jgi:NADH-quinone oxidoreductase subunit G
MGEAAFTLPLADYWLADTVSRASETMAQCSRIYNDPAPRLAAE